MDPSETTVKEFLFRMGFSNVVYEPDGNLPPDFLISGEIAVEVRRLNQNHYDGSKMRGLETVAIPLWQKMKRLIESIAGTDGNSWFVFFEFRRPEPPWKSIKPEICKSLLEFKNSTDKRNGIIYSTQNFQVDVIEASRPHETFFLLGGMIDNQSGGCVVPELISNIQYCVSEKLSKIGPYRNKYKTWWLVLTNYTGFSLDEDDREQLQQHLQLPVGWDRILLINPSDLREWVEF